jgi:hypothetical protein
VDHYRKIACYRIKDRACEDQLIDYVKSIGGRCEFRLDVIDLFVAEGPELTEFLLRWGHSVDHLSFLDYHTAARSIKY